MNTLEISTCPAIEQLLAQQADSDPGFAFYLGHRGRAVSVLTAGYADLELGVKVTPSTRFHVASLAKPFCAMAALLLVDEGRLSLCDSVSKYLPDLHRAKDIKILHLLTHTSGLRDQWPLVEMSGWRGNDAVTTEDALNAIFRQRQLNHEPGQTFRYSNSGYTVLARIIELVAGRTFRNFCQEKIFDPLDMIDTVFCDDSNELVPNRAHAYRLDQSDHGTSRWENFHPNLWVPGPTSLWTSIMDLAKWDNNFVSPVVGNGTMFSLMQTRSTLPGPAGIGLFVSHDTLGETTFHPGNDMGFHAYYGAFRSQEVSVAVLNNSGYGALQPLALSIAEHFIDCEASCRTLATNRARGNLPELPRGASYEGLYESDLGEIRRVFVDDHLMMAWDGRSRLTRLGEHRYSSASGTEQYRFQMTGDGQVEGLSVESLGYKTAWRRLPNHQSRFRITDLLGKFHSDELQCDIRICQEGTKYFVVFPKEQKHEIIGTTGAVAFADTLWLRIPDQPARIQEIHLSMPRCLNVLCTRVD